MLQHRRYTELVIIHLGCVAQKVFHIQAGGGDIRTQHAASGQHTGSRQCLAGVDSLQASRVFQDGGKLLAVTFFFLASQFQAGQLGDMLYFSEG